jgi:hypothetical protein
MLGSQMPILSPFRPICERNVAAFQALRVFFTSGHLFLTRVMGLLLWVPFSFSVK